MLSEVARGWLARAARHAVGTALAERGTPAPVCPAAPGPMPDDAGLHAPARLFVSWHLGGRLHGCIGTLEPWPSLAHGVRRFAVAAALEDPRTPPLRPEHCDRLELEISVLGEPRSLDALGLEQIARVLVPGRDGVILGHATRSAFFLPVVWQTLPEPAQFLAQLCRKAGIDAHREGPHCRARVLEAYVFSDLPACGP